MQKLFKGRKNSMKKTIWKDSICVYLDIGQQNENTCFKKKTLKSGLSLKKKNLLQCLFAETVGILMSIHEPKKKIPNA